MKKFILLVLVIFCSSLASSQGFECDGSFYLIVYTESAGETILYKVNKSGDGFNYQEIPLFTKSRYTALSYNVQDKRLYALDADHRLIVNITSDGKVHFVSDHEDLVSDFIFNSGTFAPDGNSMFMLGYNPELEADTRFYSIDLRGEKARVGYLGVTGYDDVKTLDIAYDPIRGTRYGYDSKDSRLLQIDGGGSIASHNYSNTGVSDIEALFFNREGELYGYSPSRGMYSIDKNTGLLKFIEKGPEGTHADGCSCPYTNDFYKIIEPKNIVPCETFTVEYIFNNRMGQGQILNHFRDTFPEGFEILNIDSDIISSFTTVHDDQKNILHIEDYIYLLESNSLKVEVLAPPDFRGRIESHAIQGEFPIAFEVNQKSDDPSTEEQFDPTIAYVISEENIDFKDMLTFSCDGSSAIIASPISSDNYEWSNGGSDSTIMVNEIGWYKLKVQNDCVTFFDSIYIDEFLPAKYINLGDDINIDLGETVEIIPNYDRINPQNFVWELNDALEECNNCTELNYAPTENTKVVLTIEDEDGCFYNDDVFIYVDTKKRLYVPNAFSPNNDKINDALYLSSSVDGIVEDFIIYNRWGNIVFHESNYSLNDKSIAWDGQVNNKRLNSNNFFWVARIKFVDETTETFSGQVLIISEN